MLYVLTIISVLLLALILHCGNVIVTKDALIKRQRQLIDLMHERADDAKSDDD